MKTKTTILRIYGEKWLENLSESLKESYIKDGMVNIYSFNGCKAKPITKFLDGYDSYLDLEVYY